MLDTLMIPTEQFLKMNGGSGEWIAVKIAASITCHFSKIQVYDSDHSCFRMVRAVLSQLSVFNKGYEQSSSLSMSVSFS